jgi:TRAP transporter TAXI family solute receptor
MARTGGYQTTFQVETIMNKTENKFGYKTTLLALAAAFCVSLTPSLTQAQTKKLLIGTTSSSSSFYGYFVAVSQLLNKELPGIETTVVETGATMDNLRRMERNQIDFGIVTTNVMYHADKGTDSFKGKKHPAKLLWIYSIAPQNIIVRKDSGVTDITQLAGKRFNPGLRGSGTERAVDRAFEVLNIKPDMVRGSTGEIVDAIKDNRVIGYGKSGVGFKLDASTREIAAFTPINVLGINKEQVALINKEMPEVSIVTVPADASQGTPEYTIFGFGVAAAATDALDVETAYRIVKAISEDKTVQAAAFSDVKGVNLPERTIKYATSPLHPGAIKYFKELGLEIPARLIAN